jgi:type II secretory pathway pseudopilin PulG
MTGGLDRKREQGYSLVALMASMTIMLILLGAAAPSWRYIMQDDREQELIFRGGAIADAIQRFQKKSANALPTSLDVLVKGKYLRKAYKDPMTRDGKWRLIHQGEATNPPPPTGSPRPGNTPPPTPPPASGGVVGTSIGPLLGVASKNTDKSLRLFNGRNHYNEWIFAVGQPRVIGGQLSSILPGATAPGGLSPLPPGSPRPNPSSAPR